MLFNYLYLLTKFNEAHRYKILNFARHKLKLTEADAKELVQVISEADEYSKTQTATKQDILELKNEIKEAKLIR